jgi:hypothetical protein
MTEGYIYCFSNDSMPDIVKLGMTERTPKVRLNEANSSNTWKPPTPYKLEFAKKVLNPKQKESTLHILLEKYTEKVNSKREFFRISTENLRLFFDLIDGEWWNETLKEPKLIKPDYNTELPVTKLIKKCNSNIKIPKTKLWENIWRDSYNKYIILFVREYIELDPDKKLKCKDVHEDFKIWYKDHAPGERPIKIDELKNYISDTHFPPNKKRQWVGLGIKQSLIIYI